MVKKLLLLVLLFIPIVSAQLWVDDFNDCPDNYAAQNCLVPGELVCGYDTGSSDLQCSDPSEVIAPSANETVTSTNPTSSFNGGFLINCLDYDAAGSVYCSNGAGDPYWCDYNSTLYSTKHKKTICLEDTWGETRPGECRTDNGGYYVCNGDTDICEERGGESCFTGGNHVYNQCVGTVGNCTNYLTNDLDCDDSDGDGNQNTCNAGNGCEINPGTTQNNSNSIYLTCTTFECKYNGASNEYLDCNGPGDGTDADGCEAQNNTVCYVGAVEGVISGCSGGAPICTVSPVDYGTSGVEYIWSGVQAFLWFTQLGSGPGLNITFANNKSFIVNSSGLYWDGSPVIGGGGGGTTYDQDLNTTANVTFNNVNTSTITDPNSNSYWKFRQGRAIFVYKP